jgi:hypothetical protein
VVDVALKEDALVARRSKSKQGREQSNATHWFNQIGAVPSPARSCRDMTLG